MLPGEPKPGWALREQQAHVPRRVLIVPACRGHARRAGPGVGQGMQAAGLRELTMAAHIPEEGAWASPRCPASACPVPAGIAAVSPACDLPAANQPLGPGGGQRRATAGLQSPELPWHSPQG